MKIPSKEEEEEEKKIAENIYIYLFGHQSPWDDSVKEIKENNNLWEKSCTIYYSI